MILVIYLILGYWAVGKTIYSNKVRIGTWQSLLFGRIAVALILGWALIPIAIIRLLMGR